MKHRIHLVTKWLDEKGVERVKWPLFTSDLNHLGRGWNEDEKRKEFELKQALLKVWYNIGNDVTKKLVDSVCMKSFEWMAIQLDID